MTPKWFDSEEHSEEANLRRQLEKCREANESVAVCADHTSDITHRSGCVVCDLCRAEGDAAHYSKVYDRALNQIKRLEAEVERLREAMMESAIKISSSWAKELDIKEAEIKKLRKHLADANRGAQTNFGALQLALDKIPEQMGMNKILFKECEKGHGRLVGENWVDSSCPWCEIERLKELVRNWTDLYNEIILVVQDHPWRDEYKTKHDAILGILRKTKEEGKC